MTDREKLVQLISDASQEITVSELRTYIAEYLIADYLIANGVVIREKGEWEENEYPFCNVCPKCGAIVERGCIKNHRTKIDFCPNCGADMRGENNG